MTCPFVFSQSRTSDCIQNWSSKILRGEYNKAVKKIIVILALLPLPAFAFVCNPESFASVAYYLCLIPPLLLFFRNYLDYRKGKIVGWRILKSLLISSLLSIVLIWFINFAISRFLLSPLCNEGTVHAATPKFSVPPTTTPEVAPPIRLVPPVEFQEGRII